MTARPTMRQQQDPLWRVRALAGLDPLSAEAFAIRRQPLQHGERRLIGIQFEIMQLIMLFDELAEAVGAESEVGSLQSAIGDRQARAADAAAEDANPARREAPNSERLPIVDAPQARAHLAIAPPEERATLIVADEATAKAAALAWEASQGGPYGLFVTADLDALAGGMELNKGGFKDWRHPRPALDQPAATMRWKGRVLIVLPRDLDGFTVSARTKFEKFISADRYAQVLGVLAAHWWRRAGACDVQAAILPRETQAA